MRKMFFTIAAVTLFITSSKAQCWAKVAAGTSHTIAIKNDGTLWAWGNNFHGALGDGTNADKTNPVQIGTASDWSAVTVGDYINATPNFNFSFAIKTDGTLWAWGSNNLGQLGIGTYTDVNTPVQVGTDNNWKQVSAGIYYSHAVKTDGTLWAWGYNFDGQLGLGDFTTRNSPVQVGTATDWVIVSSGYSSSAALKNDGTIWTWGMNNAGQLGDGTNTDKNFPVQVGTETDWQKVNSRGVHVMAIKTNGALWGWGANGAYQLGDGTFTNSNVPIQIGTDNDWDTVAAGYISTMALKTNGTRWAWGFNEYGEFGDGTSNIFIDVPTQIGVETDWQIISIRSTTGFGIRSGSNLWGSGLNNKGQIGNGTTTDQAVPVQINCNIILPVTWLYARVKPQNNTALVEWATEQEQNSSHFEIEHSTDGVQFIKIGTKTAAGFTSSITRYFFVHTAPAKGKNFYRVKQIDLDGKSSYSRIITLLNSHEQNGIMIYPNPAKDHIQLSINTSVTGTVLVYTLEGRQVFRQQVPAGNQQFDIDISKLKAGIYTLLLQTGNTNASASFIKQ